MGPVMANCVRRSNALLGYNAALTYSEAMLRNTSFFDTLRDTAYQALVAGAIYMPALFKHFLPGPGQGPPRETLDEGYLVVHGRGKMKDSASGAETPLTGTFRFEQDTGYLCTARMLVESGVLLRELADAGGGSGVGVVTPAVAFGSSIKDRCVEKIGATFNLEADK